MNAPTQPNVEFQSQKGKSWEKERINVSLVELVKGEIEFQINRNKMN